MSVAGSFDLAEKRLAIMRDWNANKLSYGDALRRLVQEKGGFGVETAARLLAGGAKLV